MSESTTTAGLIVVGVDGSEASKDALRWAARQAALTGASLQAVMAWHMPGMVYGPGILPFPADFNPDEETRQTLDQILTEILADHPEVQVTALVVESHPVPALLAAAEQAELLVLGSRGHGAFAGMLLGSVSEHCVAHSSCPVVVVRHRADS